MQIVTLDDDRQHGLARGAFAFVGKPTSADGLNAALSRIKSFSAPRRKRLLIVDDNKHEQDSIQALLEHDDIDITTAGTGTAAMIALHEQAYDCVVLDLKLPDMTGFDVLEQMRDEPALRDLPVVVFTGKELSAGGGCAAAHAGPQRGGQGRGVAGPPAGRDGALPPSGGRRPAGGQAARRSSACTAPTRTWSASTCWSSTTTCATSSR